MQGSETRSCLRTHRLAVLARAGALERRLLRELGVTRRREGLHALDAKKIAVGTIYSDEVNVKMTEYMEAHGFEVVGMDGLQITDPYEASLHDADSAYRLGRDVFRKSPGADAILISCGTYRSFPIIPYLEMDTGVPVVTSNQATLWHALRTLGLPDQIPDLGKLWTAA